MSKADVLLKKAEAFERLSLFSDRKTFLQRIAQDATVQQFPPMGGAGVNAPYMPGTAPPVGPAATPKPKTFLPGPGWENIPEEALKGGPASVPAPPQLGNEISVPETTISGSPPAKPMTVDPYVTALQQYLSAGPWGLQKAPDGKLGPDTRGALKNWQVSNGLKPTGMLDQDTIVALRPVIQRYTK